MLRSKFVKSNFKFQITNFKLVLFAFCILHFALCIPSFSETNPPKAVKVDFKEVELPVFIRLVSDVTGKNFTFDEKVTGKVTVISPKEVSVDELYQLFISVLQFKGFTTVPSDNVTQIIPLSDAKQNWTQVLTEEKGEGFVTRLMPLAYLNANEGVRVLTPLISRNGVINAYIQTNTIILTDTAMNAERLVALLTALDKEAPPGKGKINVYPLENAEAEDVSKTLTALFSRLQPGQQPGGSMGLTGPCKYFSRQGHKLPGDNVCPGGL